jgi:hypothetical protein
MASSMTASPDVLVANPCTNKLLSAHSNSVYRDIQNSVFYRDIQNSMKYTLG